MITAVLEVAAVEPVFPLPAHSYELGVMDCGLVRLEVALGPVI
jgi:hypothetical protein